MTQPCGGCEGKGAHRRWCPASVGHSASVFGRHAAAAEDLADSVGSNEPGAANHLYAAAGLLRELAEQRRDEWRSWQKPFVEAALRGDEIRLEHTRKGPRWAAYPKEKLTPTDQPHDFGPPWPEGHDPDSKEER